MEIQRVKEREKAKAENRVYWEPIGCCAVALRGLPGIDAWIAREYSGWDVYVTIETFSCYPRFRFYIPSLDRQRKARQLLRRVVIHMLKAMPGTF